MVKPQYVTRRTEVPFCTEQPEGPFSVVRLATFYNCRCPAEWLQGKNALDMMLRLKELAAGSGFTVIGEHYDLYGNTRLEKIINGWTVNLTFAQSGASFDGWHLWGTVDINVHWCHEDGELNGPSPTQYVEEELFKLLEELFRPEVAEYNQRIYRPLRGAKT